ncbi:MAG TPA: rod shape-determining protein RodA [Armatimonadota bacterium]|nr:rod shape-determining protein RodA [Armatimonadota bacterium]
MTYDSRSPGIDIGIVYAVIALAIIGLLAIFSASHFVDGYGKVLRQGIWMILGVGGAWWIGRFDYRLWARYWRVFLIVSLLALLFTLLLAHPVNGARSWIDLGLFRLQPSEFIKLALIIGLAALLARYGYRIQKAAFFVRSILFIAFPVLLILAQPDLGTAVVLCTIWLVMVMIAGSRWWMLGAVCLAAVALFIAAWFIPLHGGGTLIKDYQKQRLDFVHADPAGNGYHQRQARIAIGAGGVIGQGYLHGSQAQRGFLPEQDTDFIFAVIGEEFGLLGCLVVIGLFLFLLYRLLCLCEEAETQFGRLIIAGVTAMLAIHVIINIGMCLSLCPVTGVPLPFVSYGGSNLLTNLLAIGVTLNVSRHRQLRREWAATNELIHL